MRKAIFIAAVTAVTAISAEAVPGRIASETDKFRVATEAAERSAAPGA